MCSFCEGEKEGIILFSDDGKTYVSIEINKHDCLETCTSIPDSIDTYSGEFTIKYCPMCGRELPRAPSRDLYEKGTHK